MGAKGSKIETRLAHCPGEVRDRPVNRNHEVERGHDAGGIGEIPELLAEAQNARIGGEQRPVLRADFARAGAARYGTDAGTVSTCVLNASGRLSSGQ